MGKGEKGGREVTSLHGLIKVQRIEPLPMMLFVIYPTRKNTETEDGIACVDADIASYVLMSALSVPLRGLVKEELAANPTMRQFHPDTQVSYDQKAARQSDRPVAHGEEDLFGIAESMEEEIEYYRLVHEQGVDSEEARLRVFGPLSEGE